MHTPKKMFTESRVFVLFAFIFQVVFTQVWTITKMKWTERCSFFKLIFTEYFVLWQSKEKNSFLVCRMDFFISTDKKTKA